VVSTDELATAAMMAHSGGDGMARAGGVKGQLGHSVQWCKCQTELASVLMAKRWSAWRPAVIASIAWSRARGRC
jgi:hypothetical protein